MIPTPVELDLHEWWMDHDEVVAFARWYWDGMYSKSGRDIIDFFEKPWKWTPEYEGFLKERSADG